MEGKLRKWFRKEPRKPVLASLQATSTSEFSATTIWEFYRHDTKKGERWSWRVIHENVLLITGGDFDFYIDAFHDAVRHGLSAAHSVWRVGNSMDEETTKPGGFGHRALRTCRRLIQASHQWKRHH